MKSVSNQIQLNFKTRTFWISKITVLFLSAFLFSMNATYANYGNSNADSNSNNGLDEESMSCLSSVNLSISNAGYSIIHPSMLLAGTYPDYDDFIVDIMGPLGDSIWCDHVGQTLMVAVIDTVNNNSCMGEVFVEDKIKPNIICDPVTVPCNTNPWIEDPDFFQVIITDNCTDPDDLDVWFTQTINNLNCDPLYSAIVTRTWFAKDNYNNQASCTQTIYFSKPEIDDIIIPANDTLDCPAVNTDPEFTGYPTYLGDPIDFFCEIIAWHEDQIIEGCGDTYKIMRTWNIMDWCTGEQTDGIQVIAIMDTIPPTLTCPEDITMSTDPGQCYKTLSIPDLGISDNCSQPGDWTINIQVNGMFVPQNSVQLPVGEHEVTYSVTDGCWNTSTCTMNVTVEDNETPILVCDDLVVSLNETGEAVISYTDLIDFSYYDNCEIVDTCIMRMGTCGNPNDLICNDFVSFCCADVGQFPMLIVTVTDAAGNSNSCMVEVEVQDKVDPTIDCGDDIVVSEDSGSCDATVVLDPPQADDNCPGYNINGVRDDGLTLTDPYPFGTTTITWTVTDAGGNTASCDQTVTVEDNIPPTVVCPPDVTFGTNGIDCAGTGNIGVANAIDNCPNVTVTGVRSDGLGLNELYPKGETTITWTATDASGNQATCDQLVTVVDDDPPAITCPADINQTADPDECSALISNLGTPLVTDNCPDPTYEGSRSDGLALTDPYPVGVTIITWTATDCGDNTTSCVQFITVTDDQDPVITCPSDVVTGTNNGDCAATLTSNEIGTPSLVDNCPGVTAVGVRDDGLSLTAPFPKGNTVITWTATDASGNTAECDQLIVVQDDDPPTITCPADITMDTDPDLCEAFVTVPAPVVTDNCPDWTVVNNYTGTDDASAVYPVGTTTVTFTVTDCGNLIAMCTIDIIVEDNNDLTITCPDDITVSNDPGLCEAFVVVPLPDTMDNCGVMNLVNDYTNTANASAVYPVGTTFVTYTVTDDSGNMVTCSFTVTVEDNEDPEIVCPADLITGTTDNNCSASISLDLIGTPTVTDNCPGSTFSGVRDDGLALTDLYPKGNTTITWTGTDAAGNTVTCDQLITVEDDDPPSITCPDDITVDTDPGVCEAFVIVPSPVVVDNCPDWTVTNDYTNTDNASGVYPLGTTIVTFTVTDCGNLIAQCTVNITVEDNNDLIITCPDDITVSNDPGECTADVSIPLPVTSDNCGVMSVINDYTNVANASGVYPVGTTTVTYTVTDDSGNTATCSFNVTVVDDENPSIICPPDLTVGTTDGNCSASISLATIGEPTVTDNCPGSTFSGVRDDGLALAALYLKGTTTITWTGTDAAGNTVTCDQTITVEDDDPPSITCPDDITVDTDPGVCEAFVIVPSPVVVDNCPDWTVTNDYTNTDNASGVYPLGTTIVTFTVTDCGNLIAQCTVNITVEDNNDLSITCPDDITVSNDPGECTADVSIPLPVTSDNCGVMSVINDYTNLANASGVYPVGTTTVTYTATDDSGNTVTCSFTVTVVDDEDPSIICPPDLTVGTTDGNCSASISLDNIGDPTVTDNCPGSTFSGVRDDGLALTDLYPKGNTTITWTGTDAAGNTVTCDQIITVEDDDPPSITCPDDITVDTDPGVCEAFVTVPSPVVTDNCPDWTVTNDYTNTDNASGVYPVGTTVVTFTVTDCGNLIAQCTVNITVEDNNDLSITCPDDITVSNDPGECTADVSIPLPLTSDNCGVMSVINDYTNVANASGVYPVGTTTVIYTATDDSGNTVTCSFTVTVVDDENPSIICPPDLTVGTTDGNCSASISLDNIGDPNVTDNCPGSTFSGVRDDGLALTDLYPKGNTTITWTGTDAAGNTITCDQIITVEDDDPPTIDCPIDVTFGTDPGVCSAVLTSTQLGDAIYLDNCPDSTLTLSRSDGLALSDPFPKGETVVTYTVTDCGGNTASCDQLVTIIDDEPAVITCPADITISNLPNECSRLVFIDIPDTTDNCEIVSLTNDYTGTANATAFYFVGTTVVTWTAVDCGGNISTCSMSVTVVDDIPPVLICPDDIVVDSDPGLCSATVDVPLPDTSDNCGIVTLINDFNGTTNASGVYPIGVTTVVWIAIDEAGNADTCDMTITVLDNEAPVVVCPDDITIDCAEDFSNPNLFGDATVSDNCPGVTLSIDTVYNLNQCLGGIITRTFIATDASGNADTCVQTITVQEDEPFSANSIIWPVSPLLGVDCGSPLHPDSLGSNVSFNIATSGCYNLGVTFTDASMCIPGVGVELTRSWTVIDSCQFDPATGAGVFTFDQIIPIADDEAPIIDQIDDITVFADPVNCEGMATLDDVVVSDCSPILSVTNNSPFGQDSLNVSGIYPLGVTDITYYAEDCSGNIDSMNFSITVVDTVPPEMSCIKVAFFIDDSQTVTVIPGPFVTMLSDNCTDSTDVTLAFSPDPNDTTIVYTCDDIAEIPIVIYAIDPDGNYDSCHTTVGVVPEDPDICPNFPISIAGQITNEDGASMQDVELLVDAPGMDQVMTADDGTYIISGFEDGSDYTVTPQKLTDPLNGVTTYDIVMLQKHILQLEPLNSPYKIIAADIDHSEKVTAIDIIELRKLILGYYSDFPNNESWRFVKDGYIFLNPNEPLKYDFPEEAIFEPISSFHTGINFTAIKIGDLNMTAQTNSLSKVEDRGNPESIYLNFADRSFEKGEFVEVPINLFSENDLLGFQFSLGFDDHVLQDFEVITTVNGVLSNEHLGRVDHSNGLVNISYSTAISEDLNEEEAMHIRFIAGQAGKLSDYLNISVDGLHPEAYSDYKFLNVKLSFGTEIQEEVDDMILYQNEPNPFSDNTFIPFYIKDGNQVDFSGT